MTERASSGTTKATMNIEMSSAAAMVIESVLKNAPVTPERKSQRNENDHGREARSHQRPQELLTGRQHRVLSERDVVIGPRQRPRAARNMLHHDDRVVDDEADRGRHAAERHDVEALPSSLQQQDRGGEHGRHDQDGDERDLASCAGRATARAPASTTPIRIASRTLPADSTTSVLWSYQFATVTPSGI